MTGEPELPPTTHVDQLRSEVSSLQEIVGHLVLLIGSVHKGEPNNFQLEHVRQKEKRGQTGGPQHSLHNSLQAKRGTQQSGLPKQHAATTA